MTKLQEQKAAFILDQIRRVIANPGNAEKVAKALARDWHPTIHVNKDGTSTFRLTED